jgi:hypothetical protein
MSHLRSCSTSHSGGPSRVHMLYDDMGIDDPAEIMGWDVHRQPSVGVRLTPKTQAYESDGEFIGFCIEGIQLVF